MAAPHEQHDAADFSCIYFELNRIWQDSVVGAHLGKQCSQTQGIIYVYIYIATLDIYHFASPTGLEGCIVTGIVDSLAFML